MTPLNINEISMSESCGFLLDNHKDIGPKKPPTENPQVDNIIKLTLTCCFVSSKTFLKMLTHSSLMPSIESDKDSIIRRF